MAGTFKEEVKASINWGRGLELGAVLGSMLMAVVFNFLSARHFTRWDWTAGKRYTLTAPTLETLHKLDEPIEVWVLMSNGDPLEISIQKMLDSYAVETNRLEVHYLDPDRDVVPLADVRKRFHIDTPLSAGADAIMIVAHGDRHWFLSPSDMVQVSSTDDTKAKPREEQAITGAIRNVLAGQKSKLCFTAGHGEPSLKDAEQGILFLDQILQKDNYEDTSVDTTAPNAQDPFKGCDVVIVAAPQAGFTKEEAARLKTYLMLGGNALIASSPINSPTETGMSPLGLDDALAPFGIATDDDLVIETDPNAVIPESRGTRFITKVNPHAVTSALAAPPGGMREPPRVVLEVLRSLSHVSRDGSAAAVDLLSSGPSSFAVSSIAGAAQWSETPEKKPQDRSGPFVLAMASERAKVSPSAPHGPRVVVIGTSWIMMSKNWNEPAPVRGAAMLVESAISWLAAKPQILDVPERPSVAAGIRITDESRTKVLWYVLVYMPLAVLLMAAAVWFWRRSTEREKRKPAKS